MSLCNADMHIDKLNIQYFLCVYKRSERAPFFLIFRTDVFCILAASVNMYLC
jgi:hypothetical protein